MTDERSRYLAYLLRMWRVRGPAETCDRDEQAHWRASLESPRTHERRGFECLDELFDFLRQQTSAPPDGDTEGLGSMG